MFTFQDVAKVFPPAAVLERVLVWWMAQPGGDVAVTRAAEEFFGGLGNVPLETEEERAVDMLRFMEWFLLDSPVEGGTVLDRWAAQADASDAAAIEDLKANRHDRWTVKFKESPRLTVAPVGGGSSLTIDNPDLARDANLNEQVVGRFYRWQGAWLPSVTLFFLPADEQPAQAEGPLDALSAQKKFFMVDPADAEQFQTMVERFFAATAAEDEAALKSLIEPEGEVALVYDVWGWPGVRMLTDWGQKAQGPRVFSMEPDMGAMRTEIAWGEATGERGATLWWFPGEATGGDGTGWRVVEAMPELEDGPVNPAFAAAMDKGATPAWRAEAPDAVEEKLRKSMAARKLAMLDQGTMIKAWRMTSERALRDPSQPEAWAAAVEAFFYASAQMDVSMNQVADTYGAKKSLVKERFDVLSETFNQLAGQR